MPEAPESQEPEQQQGDQGQQGDGQQGEPRQQDEQRVAPENDLWNDPVAAEKEILKLRKENKTRRERERAIDPKKIAAYDKWVESQKTEQEKQAALYEAQVERGNKLARRAARAEVMVLAAGQFADPSDAADTLDVAGFLNDNGEFDTDAANAALKELLDRKPHWAKQGEQSKGPRPDPSQGRKGSANQNLEEQIAQAMKDGDINRAMSLRNGQLFEQVRLQKTN